MKYKRQIVIICLLTFLLVPFSRSEKASANELTPLISEGLAVASASACISAMFGILTSVGLVAMSPFVYQKVESFYNDNPEVFDGAVSIGQSLDGKIAVSKDFVFRFLGYIKESLGLYPQGGTFGMELTIGVNSAKLYNGISVSKYFSDDCGLVFYKPLGTIDTGSGYLINNLRGYTKPSQLYFKYETSSSLTSFNVKDSYGYVVYITDSFKVNPEGVILYQTGNTVEWGGVTSESANSICVGDTLYSEDELKGDMIFNPSTDLSSDVYGPGVGVPSGSLDLETYKPQGVGVLEEDGSISLPSIDTGENEGSIDKPNTDVGEIPTTGEGLWDSLFGWLGTLFAPLTALLEWIGEMVNDILDALKNLIMPKEMDKIDFSPLYFSFADKFPFCIPFDLIRMVKEFQAEEEKPIFKVDMSGFSSGKMTKGEVGFTIDLTKFDDLILIVKTLTLVSFIFVIAFKTRDIIKG